MCSFWRKMSILRRVAPTFVFRVFSVVVVVVKAVVSHANAADDLRAFFACCRNERVRAFSQKQNVT